MAIDRKIAVEIKGDVVTLEVTCASRYEARVTYEDITERLLAGESIVLKVWPKVAPLERP